MLLTEIPLYLMSKLATFYSAIASVSFLADVGVSD